MNILKLAKNWWENLEYLKVTELLNQYYPNKIINDEEIENIFYNEVILKWWNNCDRADLYSKHIRHIGSHLIATENDIKEIYLKEHFKEEPKYDGNGKLISGQPKNEWVSCVGYSSQEYPDFKKGYGIECFNGVKGTIEAYNNPYLYIEGQVDEIHKINVKAYIAFEQPLSLNKDAEVNSCFQKDVNGNCSFPNCDCKNSQSKVEDNNLNDTLIKFFYYLKHDKGMEQLEDSMLTDFQTTLYIN